MLYYYIPYYTILYYTILYYIFAQDIQGSPFNLVVRPPTEYQQIGAVPRPFSNSNSNSIAQHSIA